MAMRQRALLDMIHNARQNIAARAKPNGAMKYADKTLAHCETYIMATSAPTKNHTPTKYDHRGKEVIKCLWDTYGDECMYIYTIMQTYKHLYAHEEDPDDTTHMDAAEWYHAIAKTIEIKHKNDPEWEYRKEVIKK